MHFINLVSCPASNLKMCPVLTEEIGVLRYCTVLYCIVPVLYCTVPGLTEEVAEDAEEGERHLQQHAGHHAQVRLHLATLTVC